MASGKRWTRDEVLLALHLYERIPFGQQHQHNPEVIQLAERLGRTASSVAMKLNNLTSLDPEERARGIRGLEGASALDRAVWDEFRASPEVVEEAERLWEGADDAESSREEDRAWQGPTEAFAQRKVRWAQQYFQRVVLANFGGRCALTGMSERALLIASHIVPWSVAPEHRVNPANGLCLNRLHDAAFDSHLITFDEDMRLLISRRLRDNLSHESLAAGFLAYEGRALAKVERRPISGVFLARQREIFEVLRNQVWVDQADG